MPPKISAKICSCSGGTVVGFIAALLTLMEKLLDIEEPLASLTSKKERKSPSSTERPAPDYASHDRFLSSKPFRGDVTYLLLQPKPSVIVAARLTASAMLGLTLSRHLESILFLDYERELACWLRVLLGSW